MGTVRTIAMLVLVGVVISGCEGGGSAPRCEDLGLAMLIPTCEAGGASCSDTTYSISVIVADDQCSFTFDRAPSIDCSSGEPMCPGGAAPICISGTNPSETECATLVADCAYRGGSSCLYAADEAGIRTGAVTVTP